jgi:8-oxo-dGTP diphosphatase
MRTRPSCTVCDSGQVSGLRFTTIVDAPLTVAFDVARALGRPWKAPLRELESVRPERDRYEFTDRRGRRVTHTRQFTATGSGTRVDEEIDWSAGDWSAGDWSPGYWTTGRLPRGPWRGRGMRRAMRLHLDAFAAAAGERARAVVQVVGAAVIDDGRLLVARRAGGAYDGCWEFPGGKVERDEADLAGLAREIREELGIGVVPQGFLGEVVLDGPVGGGRPGSSTLRVWRCRLSAGVPEAREHAELRWVQAAELEALDWIAADRPLLPAVRPYLR